MRIALDAMGGDYAPKNTIEGAVLALQEYPYIEKLFLVGDVVATGNEPKRLEFKDARIEIFHASEVVSMRTPRFVVRSIWSKMDRLTRSFPLDTPGQPSRPPSSNSGH